MDQFLMWIGGSIITLGSGITGWVFKMVFDSIKSLEKDHHDLKQNLSNHKLHAAETFATKVDVQSGFDKVMTKLDKIDDKLDSKQDKVR